MLEKANLVCCPSWLHFSHKLVARCYFLNYFLVLYTETLQNEIPPSYRGQLVKYSYKITVGTQRVNSNIKLLRIPLRILVIDGSYYIKIKLEVSHSKFLTRQIFSSGFPEVGACEDSIDLSPSNPFLDICEKDKELEPTLQVLQVSEKTHLMCSLKISARPTKWTIL